MWPRSLSPGGPAPRPGNTNSGAVDFQRAGPQTVPKPLPRPLSRGTRKAARDPGEADPAQGRLAPKRQGGRARSLHGVGTGFPYAVSLAGLLGAAFHRRAGHRVGPIGTGAPGRRLPEAINMPNTLYTQQF